MASVIKAGNATDGVQVTSDNTGILELKTGTGAGTTAVTVDASQNVGVGTTTPTAKLDVANGRIAGSNGSASSYPNANDEFASASRTNNVFSGSTAGWRNAGVINVETGASAATRSTTGLLLLSTYGASAYASAGVNINCNTGNGTIEFFTGGGTVAPTQKMALDNSGNMGLGVAATSGYRARIRGEGSTNATRALLVDNSAGSAMLEILNDGSMNFGATTPRMVLTSAGRVGIGQQNPATLLDVAGSITYAIASSTASGLNPVATFTYNNNTANTIGTVNYGFLLIGISQGNGPTYIPVFLNAGGGIAWSFNAFDPDAGTFVNGAGPTINFATAGTSANSYQIVFSGGNGTATIQRTAGSTAYTVSTFAIAN